jgi:hypothetical protein
MMNFTCGIRAAVTQSANRKIASKECSKQEAGEIRATIETHRNAEAPVQPKLYTRKGRTRLVLMLIIPGGRRSRLADSVSLTGMLIKLSYYALPRFHEIIAVHRLKLRVASFTDTYDSGRLASTIRSFRSGISTVTPFAPKRLSSVNFKVYRCFLPSISNTFATNCAILGLPVSRAPRGV